MEQCEAESLLEAGSKVREQPSTETIGDGLGDGYRNVIKEFNANSLTTKDWLCVL